MAAAKKAKQQKPGAAIAAGVGESKRFGGGNYEREARRGRRPDLSQCTVNGGPIPEHMLSVTTYAMTDQCREEREAMLDATRPGWRDEPHVSIGRDPLEKSVDKFRDGLIDGVEPWEGGIDPLLEMKKKHGKPGERYRFLNPVKVDRDGWREAGNRLRYSKKGIEKTVELGRMIFAKMHGGARAEARPVLSR